MAKGGLQTPKTPLGSAPVDKDVIILTVIIRALFTKPETRQPFGVASSVKISYMFSKCEKHKDT